MADHPLAGRRWYVLLTLCLSLLGVTLVGVAGLGLSIRHEQAAARAQRAIESRVNDQWCDLLRPLDDAYMATPPTTDTGRNIAQAIHGLRVQLDC